jgi:hypothetical protein
VGAIIIMIVAAGMAVTAGSVRRFVITEEAVASGRGGRPPAAPG